MEQDGDGIDGLEDRVHPGSVEIEQLIQRQAALARDVLPSRLCRRIDLMLERISSGESTWARRKNARPNSRKSWIGCT